MASGTQSPPLEATGSHLPMGVSSIDGTCSRPMKDIEQRAEYFSDAVRRDSVTRHILSRPYFPLEPASEKVKEQYAQCSVAEKLPPVEKETQKK